MGHGGYRRVSKMNVVIVMVETANPGAFLRSNPADFPKRPTLSMGSLRITSSTVEVLNPTSPAERMLSEIPSMKDTSSSLGVLYVGIGAGQATHGD